MSSHVKYYQVAGMTIEVRSEYPISENTFHSKFRYFKAAGPGEDHILINHHFSWPTDKIKALGNVIYNKHQWQVFREADTWVYLYNPMIPGEPEYRTAGFFSHDHTRVDIYSDQISPEQYKNRRFESLSLLNNDQILFAKLLSNRQGLILHSNGLEIEGKGILLSGVSGSGKSTLSKMLKEKGVPMLCDDRMFIRKKKGQFHIYGNWCHGKVPDVSSLNVPLKAIFFLEKSSRNCIIKIHEKKLLVPRIIQAMVKPFLFAGEWDRSLSIIEDLIRQVGWYSLKFNLSGNITNHIFNVLKEQP